jgi:fructosamine-3-kinase
VVLGDGSALVAKTNTSDRKSIFDEEAHCLRSLADTRTVVVPQPLICIEHEGIAVLLMTKVDEPGSRSSSKASMRQFGEDLAALHAVSAGDRFGFDQHNHLGSTPQPNTWCDDWVEFNAMHRLGFQVERASKAGLLSNNERFRFDQLILKLDQFIPRKPKASLLHGDLWSGNALPTSVRRNGESVLTCAVIDPACSIGDGWADIAMMKLFGGFDPTCFDAYTNNIDDRESLEERIAVYQLYHLLNHVNIFGQGYVAQAMNLVRQLGF